LASRWSGVCWSPVVVATYGAWPGHPDLTGVIGLRAAA
jgi:hypothetical protein